MISDIRLPISDIRIPNIGRPCTYILRPISIYDVQYRYWTSDMISDIPVPIFDIRVPISDVSVPISDVQAPISDVWVPISDI